MKSASRGSPKNPSKENKALPKGDRRSSRRKAAEEPNRSPMGSLGKIAIVLVLLGGVGLIGLNLF
jgi:hypothetical protein